MRIKKEIEERIKDIEKALEDLNERGNLTAELHLELNIKIETLRWVIE